MLGRIARPLPLTRDASGVYSVNGINVYPESAMEAMPDSPAIRGDIDMGFGKFVVVPVPNDPQARVYIHSPSWWWLVGAFAAGWAGGYATWVVIGRMKAKKGGLMGLGGARERARTYEAWTHGYSRRHRVPIKVLADFSDDTAHTMLQMIVEDGLPPMEAYSAVVDASQRAANSVRSMPSVSVRGLRGLSGTSAEHLRMAKNHVRLASDFPRKSPARQELAIRASEELFWVDPSGERSELMARVGELRR